MNEDVQQNPQYIFFLNIIKAKVSKFTKHPSCDYN